MEDTSWIKPQLDSLFAGKITDMYLQGVIADKIKMFGGKLYKYYSFAPNDSNHSIDNFENNIIYFSLPQKFNDPFDCVMGISLDEMTRSFLLSVVDDRIAVTDSNSELIKEAIKGCLGGESPSADDPTVRLVILLLKQKEFKEIIEREIKGEHSTDAEVAHAIMKSFSDMNFVTAFFSILSNPNSTLDLGQAMNQEKTAVLIRKIFQDRELLMAFCPPDTESRKALGVIDEINNQQGTVNKIKALAKMSDQDIHIDEGLEEAQARIHEAIQAIKDKINEIFGITCFAERNDNILMWSHYADKHTGFCVEYDLSKMKSQEAKLMLYPVIYSKKRPLFPLSMFDFTDIKNVKVAEGVFPYADIAESLLTKSDIWYYEEEWRIIHTLKNLDEQKLYEDIITGVYLGANISSDNEKILREKAIQKGVPIKKMRLLEDKYELEAVDT